MAPDPIPIQNVNQEDERRKKFIAIGKACFLTLALITALGLSIWAFVDVKRDVGNWKESKDFEDSLKDEIEAMGNKSDARILLLAREIKEFKVSYLSKLDDLKYTISSKIVKLNQDLLNVQGDVSGIQSKVNSLQRSLENLKNAFDNEHVKVWAEFTRIENEIKNLPTANSEGNTGKSMEMLCLVISLIITTSMALVA